MPEASPPPYGRLVTLRRRVPSQNQTQYGHWRAYAKERDLWYLLLRAVLPPRLPPEVPVRLALRSYRTRLVDFANLVGGAKPIPDGLVRLGYLKDDSPRWFHCDYCQLQVPKSEERTELEFLSWSAEDFL
jgi:hypothetical protein